MSYSQVLSYSEEQFRRLTGVKKATFHKMVEILTEAQTRKKAKGGRPNKLTLPEMLLMTLEYLREYRTYFHVGVSYGLSESNAYQTIRWVENTLVKSKAFALPGKKALRDESPDMEVILIDATETPIQRPKKRTPALLGQKEAAHDKNASSRRVSVRNDSLHPCLLRSQTRFTPAQGFTASNTSRHPGDHGYGIHRHSQALFECLASQKKQQESSFDPGRQNLQPNRLAATNPQRASDRFAQAL